jgi:probable HAF family extracellular repeat protein
MYDLGTLGGDFSEGNAISNNGLVAGDSTIALNGSTHAFLYDGALHDLGTLGGTLSIGLAINAGGHVTGFATTADGHSHAFLYEAGAMTDLNSLIDSTSGWTLNSAEAINNAGWIVGSGTIGLQTHAFLLTPVPEPTSSALAACGLAFLLAVRRRIIRRR